MQILSSQPASSSSSISRSPSPTFSNSKEAETNQEEEQLLNQQVEGCAVEAAQPGSDTKKIRDPQQADRLLQQLAQTKARIFNSLDSVSANLNQIHGRFDQLEPKALYLVLPVCLLSLSVSLYAMNAVQGKPNYQSTQVLDNLLRQVSQPEQADNNMLNRLDLIEAEFNRMSGLLNQPGLKDLHPAFSVCAFSLFLCFCIIGTLWKKLNNQSMENKERSLEIDELKKALDGLENEKSEMITSFDTRFSDQSKYIEALQNKLTELEIELKKVQTSQVERFRVVDNFKNELNNQSGQIKTLQSEFDVLDTRFHFKNEKLSWAKITEVPTTLTGFGITDLHAFNGPDQQSLGAHGYQKLPGNLIFQWGHTPIDAWGSEIYFPRHFPNAVFTIHLSHIDTTPSYCLSYSIRDQAKFFATAVTYAGNRYPINISWFALGH